MRTVLSRLFERFQSAGIGDAKKRARYSDDIQLVTVVDNFSLGLPTIPFSYDNLIPSTVPPLYEVGASLGTGNRPTYELSPGGRGLWLYGIIWQPSTAFNWGYWTIPAFRIPVPTVVNPTQLNAGAFGNAQDSLATFQSGFTAQDIPSNVMRRASVSQANGGTGMHTFPQPYFVAVGTVITAQVINSNTGREIGFMYRDIPAV